MKSATQGEQRLYQFLVQSAKAAKLDDRQLVLEVMKHVSDRLSIGGQGDAVLMELIARFEKAKGIEEVEDFGPEYVIRFESGDFKMRAGYTRSLPEADHYLTREDAEKAASAYTGCAVVSVSSL